MADRRRSGGYLLTVRAGGATAEIPVLIQSNRRAEILVVAPETTWIGDARATDDDGNGFPNTLVARSSVRYPRIQAGLPESFRDDVAPVLVFLDRARIRYDLTTDLALAAAGTRAGPRPTDRPGVMLVGQATYMPSSLARRFRRYALDGGRVAVLSTGGLRRTVRVTKNSIERPTAPDRTDIFGLRLGDVRDQPVPPPDLANTEDDVGLFFGTGGKLGDVRAIEPIMSFGRRAKVAAAMAPELTDEQAEQADESTEAPVPDPVLAAARFGKGLIIRTGIPDWGAALCEPGSRSQIMRNIVDLVRGTKPRVRDAGQGCGAEPRERKRRRR